LHATDFQRMFIYEHWANRECLTALRAAALVSPDMAGRMAHILSAQKLWLERILRQHQTMPVWPASTLDECASLADDVAAGWQTYLTQPESRSSAPAMNEVVEYRNTKGEPWSSRVEDILMHVLFHSAYHRGQIALQMRVCGMQPASSDFIHAVRQGFVE
jgi:uncharacterized damage-inducible protein DinB